MTEHWERTRVIGYMPEKGSLEEDVLHRRGEDPLVMAFRRNRALAGCGSFSVSTVEAFTQIRTEGDGRRRRSEIPQDGGSRFEEWEW